MRAVCAKPNWEHILTPSVASFCPNQIENAPKLATVPVFLTTNWEHLSVNWRHFGYLVASLRGCSVDRRETSAEPSDA